MAYTAPSVLQFQQQFSRDFPYGTDPSISVLDSDITSAFQFANINFNQALWPDQGSFTLGYLLLSAHYLVLNLRASSQGLNGQYNWIQNSKSASNVSEAFSIPQRILDNPVFAMLGKTNYGAQYLQLLLPQLAGQIYSVQGTTRS